MADAEQKQPATAKRNVQEVLAPADEAFAKRIKTAVTNTRDHLDTYGKLVRSYNALQYEFEDGDTTKLAVRLQAFEDSEREIFEHLKEVHESELKDEFAEDLQTNDGWCDGDICNACPRCH